MVFLKNKNITDKNAWVPCVKRIRIKQNEKQVHFIECSDNRECRDWCHCIRLDRKFMDFVKEVINSRGISKGNDTSQRRREQ
jgi:hypothetical protein